VLKIAQFDIGMQEVNGVEIAGIDQSIGESKTLHVVLRNTRSPGPFHPSWVARAGSR
jgi:hypothetical protein